MINKSRNLRNEGAALPITVAVENGQKLPGFWSEGEYTENGKLINPETNSHTTT